MARIAGIDLPRNKRIEVALTYIYGVGRSSSREILAKAGVDLNTRSDDLTEDGSGPDSRSHRPRAQGRR